MRDELFRIADIHYALRKRRKRLSEERVAAMRADLEALDGRVKQAYDTLLEARNNLVGLVGAHLPPDAGKQKTPALETTIAALREETRLARRVQERIEADMAAALPPWDSADVTTPAGAPDRDALRA